MKKPTYSITKLILLQEVYLKSQRLLMNTLFLTRKRTRCVQEQKQIKAGRLMDVDQRSVFGARKTRYGLEDPDPKKTRKHFWGAPSSVMETLDANSLSLIPSQASVDCMHLVTLLVVALLAQQFIKNNFKNVSLFRYIELLIIIILLVCGKSLKCNWLSTSFCQH